MLWSSVKRSKKVDRSNKVWTKDEEQYLTDNYKFKRNNVLARELGRTARSVSEKANRMGLKKMSIRSERKNKWDRVKRAWSDKEERFLIENFGSMETIEMAFNLNRTTSSIRSKIENMGLK